jgi:diguanylate cyclase (GGDEF)-like protein
MQLDVPTLMLMASFVAVVMAVLLSFGWSQHRDNAAPLWLAGFNLLSAIGIVILTQKTPLSNPAATGIALSLLLFGYGCAWRAVRTFEGRRAPLWIVGAGGAAMLLATLVGGPFSLPEPRFALNALTAIAYTLAAAFELYRGRHEKLGARWPMIVLFLAQGVVFAGAVVSAALGGAPVDGPPPLNSWFGLIHFQFIVFSVGTASFLIALRMSRRLLREARVARVDGLTGLASRAAFAEAAARLLRRAVRDDTPATLVMFDLDHFKAINDNHGHQMGDAVLHRFGEVVRQQIRVNDVAGRLGGEEFALFMPGLDGDRGVTVAERIRVAFAEACATIDGDELNATLSAGVAVRQGGEPILEDLIEIADGALYRAKGFGRNRVVLGHARPGPDDRTGVVHVAGVA